MKIKTIPVLLAFLVMGVADAMGPMASAVEKNYELSAVVSTLLTFFVFIAFAVFSVPGGTFAARIGKKNLLLVGLGLNIIAMAIPTFVNPGFILLLFCIFLLGIGTTFLQVAGNPIMRDVSEKGKYSKNLALAQGIKGIGSSGSSYLVGLVLVLPFFATMGWRGVFPVFLILMILAFLFVAPLKVKETKAEVPPSILSSIKLLKEPVFALAVVGIFLYVGAEVSMGRFLKPTLGTFGYEADTAALLGPTFFFGALTIGRLIGGTVNINAHAFFKLASVLGLCGVILILTGSNYLTLAGILISGLGFANIWPMLFAITIEEKPDRASELSGLMVMAISGGAVVPLIMGEIVDTGLPTFAYIVPAICFVYLFMLSMKRKKIIA
jgi:MFS transporter, FHS family, L-fucose permease